MPFWVHTMYVLVALLTGGLLWLLADYLPGKPLWAMQRCHLKDAEYVLVHVGALYPQSVPVLSDRLCQSFCVSAPGKQWMLLQMADRKCKLAKVKEYPRQTLHGLRSQVETACEALAPFLSTLALKDLSSSHEHKGIRKWQCSLHAATGYIASAGEAFCAGFGCICV